MGSGSGAAAGAGSSYRGWKQLQGLRATSGALEQLAAARVPSREQWAGPGRGDASCLVGELVLPVSWDRGLEEGWRSRGHEGHPVCQQFAVSTVLFSIFCIRIRTRWGIYSQILHLAKRSSQGTSWRQTAIFDRISRVCPNTDSISFKQSICSWFPHWYHWYLFRILPGIDCEIYPSLGGNIERVKSQYSIFSRPGQRQYG